MQSGRRGISSPDVLVVEPRTDGLGEVDPRSRLPGVARGARAHRGGLLRPRAGRAAVLQGAATRQSCASAHLRGAVLGGLERKAGRSGFLEKTLLIRTFSSPMRMPPAGIEPAHAV